MPFAHGQHVVDAAAGRQLSVIDGESHLGGLGIAEEVISTLMALEPAVPAFQPFRWCEGAPCVTMKA